jgi:ectoine hydroxylase-related dioxygenase (phytanoyl-CoA dioxygenase family)
MDPGSTLLFLSSGRFTLDKSLKLMLIFKARHAGGANKIQDPQDPLARRVMFSYFFAKGYLRQEENLFLSIPRDVVLKMDSEMQELIGYKAAGESQFHSI